ncbi:MAG: alpha/beta fold hydrolase [Bacteroidales bacterium]|nr:alpha/beta fold hydrolase [Bacteroidales bacterium]
MKKIFLLSVFFLAFLQVLNVCGQDTLYYKADLELDKTKTLPLTLSLTREKDTTFYFLASPMQSKENFSPSKVKFNGDTLSLGFKKLNIVLKLKENEAGTALTGTFKQGLMQREVSFVRQNEKYELKRPQTPKPPFSYESKEITFRNPNSEYLFHGTLTYPKEKGKYPLVVLVSGSGCQNRDEEIFAHKPFFVIADYLTRNGIAVFRYDDRGFGETDEELYRGTTEDFAADALCAVNRVKQEEFIDRNRVGIYGHSEGGMIAQMLASELNFIILAAAPAISGKDILKSQGADLSSYTFDTAKVNDYWLKYFYEFNPKDYLKKVKIPCLVLQGGKDKQVFAEENIPLMRKYLPKKAVIKEYPELNHLFQHSQSGNPDEYMQNEETVSEEVLHDVLNFIKGI